MSDDKRGRRSVYLKGKNTPLQAGDEVVGGSPRDQLVRMDARFCARLERAIARAKERPRTTRDEGALFYRPPDGAVA